MRITATIAALAAALGFAGAAAAADAPPVLLAKVNGAGISRADFDRSWRMFLERSGVPEAEAEADPEAGELKSRMLDTLIDGELLAQEAARAKVAPGDDQVAAALAEARGQFTSEEEFTKALAQMGLTEAALRELVRRELAIQAYVDRDVAPAAAVTDAEVHEFYAGNPEVFARPEMVRARHVLAGVAEGADEKTRVAARAKAEGMLAKLKGGADFAAVAKEGSDCPSAAQGGELGTFSRGQMPEAFDAAVFALKPGELSGVVETELGFHVVRLEERIPAGAVPEAEVADRIRDHLKGEKTGKAVVARLKALREKATIELLGKP